MVRTWRSTRSVSMSEASAVTVRRRGAPLSEPPGDCSGSHSTTVREPWGEVSSVTAVTSSGGQPMSLAKDSCGEALVADAPMNRGDAP